MANLFQAWDEDIQALGAAKASDDQIEARRQQLAEHFKAKAKAAGLSSKKIYETLDQFDAYSRQNTTAQDDQLTPEEQEMTKDQGTTLGFNNGALKEVGKRFKDVGLGAVSSLTRMGGDVAQTWADVGDNDKSELSSQIAQGLYNATDDIRSNYSEGTKRAKKDFWSPAGLTMGLAENAGQIAGTAALLGTGGAAAGALGVASKAGKLATMAGMAAPLAYSQGYGQGKENSLDEINKTSNAQLWENVKAEAKAYDDAGGTGEVPYLVKQFKEAGGDLNLMKDLMAENAGNVTGLMTVGTEPLAMGVGSLMSRGAAAGGKGLRAGLVNIMNNQGMSNELARRIAAGASAAEARKAGQIVGTTALRDNAAIASQVAKIAAVQGMRGTGQEGVQEGGEGYIAKTEGSLAAGRKGELTGKDWRGEHGIIQQGLQGAAIGGIMAGGSVYSSARNASKLALEKNGLPEKHDAALVAKEQADAVLVQAANIADADPNNIDAQNAYAEAQDAALVATNDLDQLSAKFNALYTPEEQAVIKAATMEGVAARKKVADDAAKAQKELDDANAKEQADIAAQQAEAIKAQRDAVVNNLANMVGDDVALSNAVADLGLSEEEANSLLDDAHKVAKKQKKEAAKQPAPATATPKTPFEMAVDEAFNADGTRNPKAMTSDIAKKHNIPLKPLVDAISERIDSNSAKNKAAANEALAQKRQKEKQQADVLSEKQKLENTLADFAANNDHDSMVNFLRDYEPTEADKLIKNAYASVENKKKAEQDAIAATKKAEALKAKESEAKTQAEQKKIAFNRDMADLYAANPDRNPTKAELDSVGKKHGVKSPIELAQAWVKAKNEAKAAKEAAPKLAFPSPETATKDERDITVPTGMNINRDNIENSDKEPIIVRSNGQPFQTQEAAEQALKNKSTKKPRKNKAPITPETHEVITVDGGYAIAPKPVVEIQQPKKPDDNEDGGVIADAPKPNAPVSPTGEQVVDTAPTKPVEDDGIKTKHIKQPKPADRTVYPHRDDLLTAIAKMKGLNKAQAIYHGIKDRLDLNKRGRSLLGVFKDDGEGFDVVARKLSDMGYPVNEGGNTPYDNINGTPTTDALLDALRKALFGEDVGTEEYILNKYAAQREADQKEAEEMERLFNGKGSSSWDEADALDNVSDAIVNDITNVISTVAPEKLSETLKEVSNEPIIETSGQTPNAKTEARSPQNGDAETTGNGKTGQQESQSSTGQDSGIGLNPSFNLNAQTNEELAKRDADNKASEAKRQAEEKSAKDKAQADKEVSDFRLSGSNAPADIAMAGGQKDMFAPPTRGEREAEKAETKQEQPQDKVIANNETNWIGADKAFSKNIDNDYGPSGAISEAVDFAKSSPKGTTTLETIIRPNGNKWHTLYLSNGKGGLAIKSIGGKQTESLESVVAYLEDEIKKESESAEVFAQNKRKEEISNNKIAEKEGFVVGLKLGTIIPNTNRKIRQAYIAKNNNDGTFDVEGLFGNKPVIIKGMSALGIKDAIQRHQNTQTKQPETKTEPKAKIDFSEASVKLEDALNKWEAIKKGDIVVTKSGRALIAQSDAKGKMSIRFKVREGSLEEALSVLNVTGNNKVSKMLSDRLQEQSNGRFEIYPAKEQAQDKSVQNNEPAPVKQPETTIMGFLNDGELENAYFFAENQEKPIRFTLSNKKEPIAYFLTEPVDLGNNITGFVGISTAPMSKSRRWLVIEEKSRTSIGFEEITKRAAIKSAKARLSALKEEDLEIILSNIKPINKTDQEMSVEWLAKNNIKTDDEVKADVKVKVEGKQNKAIGDEILNQQPKENTVAAPAEKTKEISDEAKAKTGIIKVDFPLEETTNAWQHSIRNPSGVAKSFKQTYEDYIKRAYNLALPFAETDAQKVALEQGNLELQKEYIQKIAILNSSRSSVTSSFVAGRNNFNKAQADSRGSAFDKVMEDFDKWTTRNEESLKLTVMLARNAEQKAAERAKNAELQAEKDAKAQKLQDKNDDFLRKVLSFKKGDDFTIGKNKVVRVNVNKYGMPISLTLEGVGITKGLDDKISLYGKDMSYETIDDLKQNIERIKEADSNAQAAKPTPVTQPESKPTPIASTSSSDLTDEEYIAIKKAYNDFKAKTDKINATYSRDVALEIATGLVAEMPDKEDKIRQALIDAIRENQWNRFEINFPKQPIKVETDVELNRALKRLQKALEGTDYTIGGTFNGKSAKLLFSYKSGANGSRESVLIDRVNGKFTSYHVDFDNMGREVLKPLMDATVKWLNGEEIPKMKLGDDIKWDYTTLLSTPRHIDNAFNEAKAKAATAAPVSKSDKLAQSYDEAKAKQQPTKEEAPKQETNSKTPTLDKHNALMDSVRNGKATAEDFKQSFADISANKDAILLELNALTKDQLLKEGGYAIQYRHKNDKKSEVAEAVYHSMIAEYSLGSGITYGMGKNSYENAVQKMVDNTDQQQLDEFAKEYKQMIDGRIEKLKAKDEALKNPTTLNDFRELMRSIMAEGKSRQEAFLSLSAEHRIKYDELEAESTKEARETRKRAAQASINTSSQTTDGKIIETKHTRDGYDLFVVQLSDRLSTDDYKKVLSEAKKLGGWYSSYKGGGAIVGFQFKDKEAAQAFLALAGGDTTAAKEQLSQQQDDYADNRSQSAAERLLDMADKIETKANEELDRDRKANTARRAKFAMSAENEARAKIALAKTMRNIAESIKNGKAKFLDNIRMKVDVEALRAYITTAKDNEIRSEYDSYAEQVKRKGQPATAATADFATYPTYTLFRSDLAFLGRQLLEIDGLKKLGQQIMMVADDVSDAYLEFAKKNLDKVSRFQTKDSALAAFSSKELAERAIKRSGLTGKAIVLQVKRGENLVILSPSEAINLKVWEGDADKRITLKREFGNQLVEAVGRRAGKNNRLLPYQFQYAYDKLKALSRIGIETPSEFRSALREFIALQEEATNNKAREMEMAMVGRKKDGLDFFPTPQAIAQQMIDSAEITEDMAVLEPSAGMGHIADMIRATGAEPDVIEMSGDRRELLQEKGYHLAEVNNFMDMQPREFFTFGDVFVAPDGKEGVMRGSNGQRVRLEDDDGKIIGYYNRDDLVGERHKGVDSGYDRIIMNPPFSNRQDAEHVRHAYELLRPNGRIVAIMGEGVFFGSDKKAVEFREWLESVGGTSEKLPDNSFMDSSLPVNTGVNARMVIIDKQDSDNQTNEDKPKFNRKATESDSVPIYRIDNKNFDANNIKPHGLYVSIPSDVSTFDSPHKDVGDTSFAGNASPKNPLNVESFKIQHKRGNDYPMEVSAGVSALKQLVSVQLFERLIKANKAELTATIKEQFPDIDTSQYYDAYELLEVLGAQLAIQEGYDAIIQKNGNDPFNEMVILDNSIIESMSPTQTEQEAQKLGPYFSRSTGLTTTQTRAILVKRFGEKLIKALESSGLLTIMATPPSWAKPDADGAYDKDSGKAYLFTDNLSAETVVATLAHELAGHKGFQELMTPTAYDSLMRQFNRLVNQGNPIALAAKARAEAAEVVTPTADTKEAIALAEKQTLQRQQDEYLPYLLTQQATLNATRSQQSAVTKVIEQVYRAVKAWLYRTLSAKGYDGLASKLLQPKDITLLAERMIREMGGDLSGKTPNELQERRAMIQGLSFMGAASALGGGITLVDMSMKARDAKKIIDDILTKGKEGITPSKEFLAVIEKMANAKESVAARKRAASIVEGFITKLRGELLENSQLSGKIAINAKNIKTGEAIFIDAKDAHHESKRMFDAMTEQRKKIESQIVLAASMVESITGYKLNDLVIIPKPDSTIELLVGKQLTDGWREFGFVGASTEWQEGIKINVNAQTLIDLASGSSVIRAGAFSLIAHEMTHAIQHQLLPLNTRDSKVLGVDTFIPDGISAMHKAWLSENSDKYSSQEDSANYKAEKEGFDVGYTAAKAMLKKEGLPLRIISERDLENALLTAAQDTTSTVEALDKFNKANYSDDIRFSQLNTPQTQINAVRKKYEGTSQWMKAPNGQPTKLNEVQWLQVRTPNFKAWFGDFENDPANASKVVDENGEPLVVYHGTEYGGFTEFGSSGYGAASREKGFWFSNKIRALEYSGKNQEIEIVPVLKSWSDAAYFAKKLDVEFKKAPEDEYDDGIYFIDDDIASTLNQARNILQKAIEDKQPAGIYPVFLSLKTPKTINAKGKLATNINTLVMSNVPKKYDGMMIVDVDDAGRFGDYGYITDNYVAKTSTQIKSAIGNNGEFNPTNPDIRFSRKAKNPITEGIKSAANDAKNSLPTPIAKSIDNFMAGRILPSSDMANITAKTELSIYKRTIGTQLNTALQLPDFKKVYDMAQRYLQHVAVDAYAALKVAPNLLGKLESWSDLKKDVKKIWPANFIKQKADRAAVASIIFDETLNNELLSDADILKALTRDQRQIYKEARDAIQVSLENTAKSEMVRKLLAAEAINWSTVESMINQDLPVEQFAQTVRDMVESRIGGFKNELDAILDADPKIKEAFKTGNKNKLIPAQKKELKKAKTLKAQIETTEEALKSLNDVENRLGTLIEQGYAPLMRFGEYTLTVRDLDGKVKSFFMFESKSEQVRAVNTIVARYGKTVNLETDMISKEEFKQFAGMTPETVALFAKETGMDKDEAYQHYLKHAIPARSAMTRMIKRKGTEGFSDDIQRVVASFVMSNARMSAKNIYAAQIEKSIQAIESGKSVKDQAYVMKENVFNPKENFAQLRNFLFLWNLGGSIFFGLLNMTQPYMQTLPHLSQYVPIGDATRAILRGSKIAGSAMKNGTAPKGYEAEYNRAVREGVVDPQNVFMLSGVERGKTGASNSAWGVITHTMGLIAQVTESFNRKAVFIAALEVANKKGAVWLKKKGFNSAYDFAKDTVDQTQGVYDKANRSNWANTSVGAPLMVFKQFSINYVEQMVRMWKKEAASGDEGKKAVFLMLALLASLSGVMGLPFIKDILDVSETTAAFLGNPVNIEREARLALGKDLADPLFNGVLNHFVFNNLGMDIQGRTGMPDLVPWSNALNPTLSAQGRINEFASIAGATGGLIEKGYDATQLIARDEYGAAAKTLAPRFLTSWIDGGKMALTNEVMDRKGNKLFDTTWDEGLVKFIDANPKRMADLSRTKSLEWKDFAIQDYMTTSFKQKIIAAMMDKDQAEVNKLMKEVEVWNNARSRYPVYIDLNTLAENANKKDQTFDAREKIRKGMTWVKNERPEM